MSDLGFYQVGGGLLGFQTIHMGLAYLHTLGCLISGVNVRKNASPMDMRLYVYILLFGDVLNHGSTSDY